MSTDPDPVPTAATTTGANTPSAITPDPEIEDESLAAIVELETQLATSEAIRAQGAREASVWLAERDTARAELEQARVAHADALRAAGAAALAAVRADLSACRLYRFEYGKPIVRLWVLAPDLDAALAKVAADHPALALTHGRDTDVSLIF